MSKLVSFFVIVAIASAFVAGSVFAGSSTSHPVKENLETWFYACASRSNGALTARLDVKKHQKICNKKDVQLRIMAVRVK